MKNLTKGVFYYQSPADAKRLWHTCKKYKKETQARVELIPAEAPPDPDETIYSCPHCDFAYALDNNLQLIKSNH